MSKSVGTTATGQGVALPHVRSHVVTATALAFARLRRPLDFGAADGLPVRAAALLVAPYGVPGALYQPLLAVLAEAAHDEAGRLRLDFKAVEIPETVDEVLRSTRRQLDDKKQTSQLELADPLPKIWALSFFPDGPTLNL